MEVEQEVEVECPYCNRVFTTTVVVEIEPQDVDWRD
jgi:hypothetical protein